MPSLTELTIRFLDGDKPCHLCDAPAVVMISSDVDGDRLLLLCRSCLVGLRAATGEALLQLPERRG